MNLGTKIFSLKIIYNSSLIQIIIKEANNFIKSVPSGQF